MPPTSLSTVLIGEESLCIQCAQLLLDGGHRVLGLVTRAEPLAGWARERAIPVVAPGPDLAARIAELGAFDYLLSIANLSVLPDEVLALPTRGAINFHDGPLPRYAGLYCTSWALVNREPQHGVTWHLIEGGVDEGRILVQERFEIALDETALTLNARCYAVGIESFRALLDGLASGALTPVAQDLTQRTYFARDRRPPRMATLDWQSSAADLVALVRALDFGRYSNPLAMPKVRLDGATALVGIARVVDDGPAAPPGTVLAVDEDTAQIACTDGVVELGRWRSADGEPSSPLALGVRAGARLAQLEPTLAAALDLTQARIGRHDDFWARRLAQPRLALASPRSPERREHAVLRRESASPDALVAATCAALARLIGQERFTVGLVHPELEALRALDDWIAPVVPLAVDLEGELSLDAAATELRERIVRTRERVTYARDLVPRTPPLRPSLGYDVVIALRDAPGALAPLGARATFEVSPGAIRVLADDALDDVALRRLASAANAFLDGGGDSVHQLPILTGDEHAERLDDLARTATLYDASSTVPRAIEAQVDRTPERTALVFERASLTYAALDARANQLAHRLRERGVRRGELVGLHLDRSLELVVAMLGIQKAGAAYVPMDPQYPRERLHHMLADSGARIVVTDRGRPALLEGVATLTMDALDDAPTTRLDAGITGEDLAYVIYTSGSTGRPKGVMVEHRNVLNFFAGMDPRVSHEPPGTWLAVTSPSFDISVLELAWTLARGFTVLIHRDRRTEGDGIALEVAARPMDFGLCYWGNDDGAGRGKYQLLLEGAKWADANGLHSVWTPERHFHAFGGPYANPSVSGAAVAAITRNVAVRSCSCVLPLHHPVRVAEEWAMVDNLCDGRAGLGIAAGWMPDDFVLRPENTPPASKEAMFRDIEMLRRLWRGEAVELPRADGTLHAVVSQPRPVQAELPIWLTIALNPASWIQAADIGANVLTHLLGQSIDELGEKIRLYRARRAELGLDPAGGKVTLMLHTLVDPDREVAREVTREPLKRYLASAASLIKQYVWMFPALKRPHGAKAAENIDLDDLAPEDLDAVLEYAFSRYFEDSGLLGSVEDCVARVGALKAIGVDEIGCLIDYGVDTERMLESLPHLGEVVRRTARPPALNARTFDQLVTEHGATHLQLTPSLARMLLADDDARRALGQIQHVLIGGEALPAAVARGMLDATRATLTNMYGPTETTIWSSSDRVTDPFAITLGTPIANTALYVLDARRRLVPPGVLGELWIGGHGVTRGYLNRAELTAERFVPDPFAAGDARMYRTGDLVKRRDDGRLEFLGRVDHQVKVRGHRIELGEIEALLEEQPDVDAAVACAREIGGELELVAYVGGRSLEPRALRDALGERLPASMIPARIIVLPRLPLTPNGKVDRAALPDPTIVPPSERPPAAPESELGQKILDTWRLVLGIADVGRTDNFFDLGGHSLLAIRLHRELAAVVGARLAMTDVFRFPTVAALTAHLESGGEANAGFERVAARVSQRRKTRPSATRRVLERRE